MITIQIMLLSTTGQYKPINTLIKVDDVKDYLNHLQEYHIQAIKQMCIQRSIDWEWMKKYEYVKLESRIYDKKKIDYENKKYEEIKKARGWI